MVNHYDDDYIDIRYNLRDDLFKACLSISLHTDRDTYSLARKINAGIVRDLATEIAVTSPKAFILVISNPVNSTVPIVAEVLKKQGVFNPKRCHRMSALNHMNPLLTQLVLALGSLVLPPWTWSVLPPLSLKSSKSSLWPLPLLSPSSADTAV